MNYDVAVIGRGPAGWSCAITARMRGLRTVVIAPQTDSGFLYRAERIDNYPGMPSVSGRELLDSFARQAVELGAEHRVGLARQILPNQDAFLLLVENDVLEARTVVLAMGAARPVLLPGEEEAVGQGVSYCATCDGMLYRGKRIAVVSTGAQGVEETGFLATLAGSVDYYPLKPHDWSALPENVRVLEDVPTRLRREAAGITVETSTQQNTYDGVFVFRAAMPLGMLLSGLETEGAFIRVDRQMRTSVPGVYAAGDCTGQPLQVPKAVGEGNIAAIAAAEYIAKHFPANG